MIRGAADREEFAVALRERLLRERLTGVTALAAEFLDGALRPGMSADEAGARYAALASPELYHLLVTELGWALERYRRWLVELLETDLLGAPAVCERGDGTCPNG